MNAQEIANALKEGLTTKLPPTAMREAIDACRGEPFGFHVSIVGPALADVAFRDLDNALGGDVIDYLEQLVDPETHRWEVFLLATGDRTRLAITLFDCTAPEPLAQRDQSCLAVCRRALRRLVRRVFQ